MVFDGTGDEMGPAVGFPPGSSGAQGLVVAFTASGGEGDFPGLAAQQPGDGSREAIRAREASCPRG